MSKISFPKALSCGEVRELLPGLVSGELGVEQRGRVEGHILMCEECAVALGDEIAAEIIVPSYLNWWELSKKEVKSLITEAVDGYRAIVSRLSPVALLESAVSADDIPTLDVLVFDEHGVEKEIPFTVTSGPKVDEEEQLNLTLIAPDASYEGREITFALKLDENRQLVLASPPIVDREAFILLDIGLEPELEIPLEMIVATIEKKD